MVDGYRVLSESTDGDLSPGPRVSGGTLHASRRMGWKSRRLLERGNLDRHPDVEMDRDGRAPLLVRTPVEMTINHDAPHGRKTHELEEAYRRYC